MSALPFAPLLAITGAENVLLLVPAPLDESLWCGGLVAESCRRGRPPFVMVLGDGTASHPGSASFPPDRLANLRDRETRAAVACLGLPSDRLLLAGVHDGRIPAAGPGFDAVVRAVGTVMWARDCNLVCAPSAARHAATHRIAAAVAATTGVAHLTYAGDEPFAEGWRLDVTPHLAVKRAAIAAHASQNGGVVLDDPAPLLPVLAPPPPFEVFRRA